MVETQVTIVNEVGLHARPAGQFVKLASKYKSKITLFNGEKRAAGKSIFQVLGLGASKGVTINIQADGDDEQDALDAVVEFLRNLKE